MPNENLDLYDAATRRQIYLEGVKEEQNKQTDALLISGLLVNIRNSLTSSIRTDNVGNLTKTELNIAIVRLRKVQSKFYADYKENFNEQLKEFILVDAEVDRRLMASLLYNFENEDQDRFLMSDLQATEFLKVKADENNNHALFGLAALEAATASKLWATIDSLPIPANGLYVNDFLRSFGVSAQSAVEGIVRKAWANKQTFDEMMREIHNDGIGVVSQIKKISNQAHTVSNTIYQHASAVVFAAVASAVLQGYRWDSVIDHATTDICFHRNKKIYRYGKGPLPPAHNGCRSHTTPLFNLADFPSDSLYSWSMRQPEAIQIDLFTPSQMQKIKAKEFRAKDLEKFRSLTTLSFKQYLAKLNNIILKDKPQ